MAQHIAQAANAGPRNFRAKGFCVRRELSSRFADSLQATLDGIVHRRVFLERRFVSGARNVKFDALNVGENVLEALGL